MAELSVLSVCVWTLQLNYGHYYRRWYMKTREMVIDFRKLQHDPPTLSINGEVVKRVDSYSYLGFEISNQLDWSLNQGFYSFNGYNILD